MVSVKFDEFTNLVFVCHELIDGKWCSVYKDSSDNQLVFYRQTYIGKVDELR